jgi:hypothetical protein
MEEDEDIWYIYSARNGVWRTGEREKVKEYPGLQPQNSPLPGGGEGKLQK